MDDESCPIVLLYYSPKCPDSTLVLNFLESSEMEIPIKNIDHDPKSAEELLHLGGRAQTPCLFIDGKALYGSQDIIEWLQEKKDLLD